MKFAIIATIASLTLASFGLAAPTASPVAQAVKQEPIDDAGPPPGPGGGGQPREWKAKRGWDGSVTLIEKLVKVSIPMVVCGEDITFAEECNDELL